MTPEPIPFSDAWIVNAVPFIGLAKIGRTGLLAAPGRAVLLPDVVAREVAAGAAEDAAVQALARLSDWGVISLPPHPDDPRVSVFAVDAGEAAVLTEALARPDSLCVIDDRPGRAAAMALGLDVTGTVGILLQAHREGRLPQLAPELRGLQAAGLTGGGAVPAPRERPAYAAGPARRGLAVTRFRRRPAGPVPVLPDGQVRRHPRGWSAGRAARGLALTRRRT